MITISRFYRWVGLPQFFNILKFLGQKKQIILQCSRLTFARASLVRSLRNVQVFVASLGQFDRSRRFVRLYFGDYLSVVLSVSSNWILRCRLFVRFFVRFLSVFCLFICQFLCPSFWIFRSILMKPRGSLGIQLDHMQSVTLILFHNKAFLFIRERGRKREKGTL